MKTSFYTLVLFFVLAFLNNFFTNDKKLRQPGTDRDQGLLLLIIFGFALQIVNGATSELPVPPGCTTMLGKIVYFTYFTYTFSLYFYCERVLRGYYDAEQLYAIRTITLAMLFLYLALIVSAEKTRVQDLISHGIPVTISIILDTTFSVQNFRYVGLLILPLDSIVVLSVGGIRHIYPAFPLFLSDRRSFIFCCIFSSVLFCFCTELIINLIHRRDHVDPLLSAG
jgi:hypothetical protein